MRKRHLLYRRYHKWLRHFPRRKHLRGSWLHRWLGERLFAPELWKPTRHCVAGGLAIGLFVGLTPTIGVQVFLAAMFAYWFRVNIPAAIAGALVTNPFTAPVIYALEYKLGVWLVGVPAHSDLEGYTGMMRNFARFAKPLWAGCLATGAVAAALAYGLVTLLWVEATQLRKVLKPPAPEGDADAPAPADPPPPKPEADKLPPAADMADVPRL